MSKITDETARQLQHYNSCKLDIDSCDDCKRLEWLSCKCGHLLVTHYASGVCRACACNHFTEVQ